MVLALLGTIIAGTLLNIEETTSNGTGYRNIADVTGLVSTTTDPYFTEYTPSANWTGYYTEGSDPKYISGVDFTTTTQANNYPTYDNTPVTTSGTMDLNALPEGSLIESGYEELRIYRQYNNYTSGVGYTSNPSITTLATVVNSLKTNTTISISILGGSGTYNPSRAYITDQNNGVNSPFSPSSGTKNYPANDMWWGVGGTPGNSKYVTKAWDVDISTMRATMDGVEYDANLVLVSWGGTVNQNGGSGYNDLPSTLSYTRTTANVRYMDITQGVQLNNYSTADNTIWDNGYWNGSLNMIFKGASGSSIDLDMDIYSWDGSAWSNPETNNIKIDWATVGGTYKTTITVNGTSKNIGGWNNVLMKINAELGTVEVAPITSISSYTTYTTGATSSIGSISKGAFNEMTFKPVQDGGGNALNAPYMEVVSSRVYMDTYGAVFRNATLNLSGYFPDYPNYAVAFGNFALIGDALTINNVNLPVSGDNVEYDGKNYSLKGASVVYDNGNSYLMGRDYKIDLGAIVSQDIYFSGIWYVPLTFQEIYQTLENEYSWIPYGFGFDWNTSVMVFLGLIIAFMLTAPLLKAKPKTMDWVVVVFAGIVGAGLLVVG